MFALNIRTNVVFKELNLHYTFNRGIRIIDSKPLNSMFFRVPNPQKEKNKMRKKYDMVKNGVDNSFNLTSSFSRSKCS